MLSLMLIPGGFVFSRSWKAYIYIILLSIGTYVVFGYWQIGFVLHKTMVVCGQAERYRRFGRILGEGVDLANESQG